MLSIIIVSWNTRALLRRCLQSIFDHHGTLEVEVIVVDNASHDGTPAMVRDEFPRVHLIETGANLGFSAGNNVGMRVAQGKWWLLLNPDTEIVGDALQTLVATFEQYTHVGVVGPCILYGDDSPQRTRHRFPLLWTLATASTPLAPLFAPLLNRFYYLSDSGQARTVDWLTGAALLVRREVYEQVGGFDEQFFMYFEETDWQRRIKSVGWSVLHNPAATIIHHEAASSGQVLARRHQMFNHSRLRYAVKWHGTTVAALLRGWLILLYALEAGQEGAKWLLGHKRELRRQRLDEYQKLIGSLVSERVEKYAETTERR